MIYQNIILTIFLILMLLTLWANIPNKYEIEQVKKEAEEHREYVRKTNEQVLELHCQMVDELREIKEVLNVRL